MNENFVDITSLENTTYRTVSNTKRPKLFRDGRDVYNRLSIIPEGPIDLEDGRIFQIQEWNTFSGNYYTGFLKVVTKGYIHKKEKEEREIENLREAFNSLCPCPKSLQMDERIILLKTWNPKVEVNYDDRKKLQVEFEGLIRLKEEYKYE